ncbi:YceI family protein [Eudoraea chungangensis]|uniref:YceI family protein n=1 Tax=Eudoraea chungangensis TaxID=1481905 RepID=UPI0023ECC621|nr:YceI family protein [Eudoraea chungangensis]
MRLLLYSLAFLALIYNSSDNQLIQKVTAEVRFDFLSKHVEGTIQEFKFSGDINSEDLESSIFSGSVAVETLKTGNFIRDWHLQSSKYFDEEKYPLIRFNSSSVSNEGNILNVEGKLTIKDVSKPMHWQFKKVGNLIKGSGVIYTSDFGIHIKKEREDNKVEVFIEIKL